jgi:hypothetical protein
LPEENNFKRQMEKIIRGALQLVFTGYRTSYGGKIKVAAYMENQETKYRAIQKEGNTFTCV